jgi:hypothetical protein
VGAHSVTALKLCKQCAHQKLKKPLRLNSYIFCLLGIGLFVPPAENSWVEVTPLQQARRHLGASAVNGKIYALGVIISNYQGSP